MRCRAPLLMVMMAVCLALAGCTSEPVSEAAPTPVTGETFTQDDYAAYAVATSDVMMRLEELRIDCGVPAARFDDVVEGEAGAEFGRIEKELSQFDIPEGFNVLEGRLSDELWQEMAPVAFEFAAAMLGMVVAFDVVLEGEGCETAVAWEGAGSMNEARTTE